MRWWRFAALMLAVAACQSTEPTGLPTVPTLDEQGADGWASVSAGRDHTCALNTAGRAYCWGGDNYHQLGFPATAHCDSTATSVCSLGAEPVATTLAFTAISAGATHTCAIAVDATAYCWGSSSAGALGTTTTTALVPLAVQGGRHFLVVSAGYTHTCGVTTDSTAFCWGANERGQLGTGDTIARAVPTLVVGVHKFVSIAAGQSRTCAQTAAGQVLCWGAVWLYSSQGLEYTEAQLLPSVVPAAPPLDGVTVGSTTTCGLAGQSAYCWESNPHGEIGDGTTDGSTTPVPVAGGLGFTQLSAGLIQTCGVTGDGSAYCWGNDSFGQLGVSPGALSARCSIQNLPCSLTPVRVVGWRHFVSVSTGLGNHACGVTTKTNIYCWGFDQSGQLGYGEQVGATAQPLRVVILLP